METWDILKKKIKTHNTLTKNGNNWRFRYLRIKKDFSIIPLDELKEISKNDTDIRVREEARNKITLLEKYEIRKDFNNVVTVKLILPVGCNAKCEFCYNNDYNISTIKKDFLTNLDNSIEEIVSSITPHFPVSLDITGGEPTLDVEFLKKVLNKLKLHQLINKFCRITLNTNGYNLEKVIDDLKNIVTYVNISTHNSNKTKRDLIFNTHTLKDIDYKRIVLKLLDVGIDTSTICVIYNKIDNFKTFNEDYIKWCKDIGFVSLRYRNDSFWTQSKFDDYMQNTVDDSEYNIIQLEASNDSTWCRLADNEGFFIFFLNGVLDTFKVSKGIEYIIHDDGKLYLDYSKKVKFIDYKLPYNLILDAKNSNSVTCA